MKAYFPVPGARNRADFSACRTHPSPANLTKPRPAWSRSVDQLDQLVDKQGDHAKHQVQPDLLGSPHHDAVAPKLFFQTAVEALRHRPFLVPGRLVGRQRKNLSPPAIFVDDGNVSQAAAHRLDGLRVISRIHHIFGFSRLPTAGAVFFPRRQFGGFGFTKGFSQPSMAVASRADMPHQFRGHSLRHQGLGQILTLLRLPAKSPGQPAGKSLDLDQLHDAD